jgi:DNA repair exonuclease SbcCD ATPase subunit
MQQDDKDRKNEIVVKGFEDKIKKLEDSLKEKVVLLHSTEGSLAKAQAQNEKLNKELKETQILLEENSSRFNRDTEALNMTIKVEAEKNLKLSEALKTLKDKCFNFATQCTARLKSIFNSVGAASEEASLFAEDIPGALECVEKEVDALNEVITGHVDFYALVASRGMTAAFIKVGCNHARAFNRPNFGLSPADLIDIPAEAQSIGNRFITQIWAKGDRELAGDEARNLLSKV